MANFDTAYKKVIKAEGGYVNDPDDRGGETYLGVARNFHKNSIMWKYVDEVKAVNKGASNSKLTAELKKDSRIDEEVKKIYKTKYWDKVSGDKVRKQKVAEQMFDMAVNSGVPTAIKLMQRVLGLKENGIINEEFIKLINA